MQDLAAEIKQHDAAVRRNSRDRVRYRTVCAGCGKNAPFAAHELRKRGLRYIDGGKVILVAILLARWRCGHCRRTFTDYPPFRLAV